MNDHDPSVCAAGFARLDERVKSLWDAIAAQQRSNADAVKIAADALAIRLEHLNGEQGRIAQLNATMLTREVFDVKHQEILSRLGRLEGDFLETRGKLWMPLLVSAALASAVAVGILKLI